MNQAAYERQGPQAERERERGRGRGAYFFGTVWNTDVDDVAT
jgi:hypothetical protein